MTPEEFKALDRGDIVYHASDPTATWLIDANYGDRVTAVTTYDLTNPAEWVLVLKANYERRETK